MTLSEIRSLPAIDIHAHCGNWNLPEAERIIQQAEMPGELELLLRNSALASTAVTVVSHLGTLFPVGKGNPRFNDVCLFETASQPRVMMLCTLNPLYPDCYRQAERLLREPKCLGLKLHPAVHGYEIRVYGGEIYSFAARHHAPIITHSGEQNCMPEDFAFFADRYPEVTTVVSHLGCGWDGDTGHQIRAIERCKNGNLYTDTSSWHSMEMNLLERAVDALGAGRILYGTDSACYFSPSQRARIDCSALSDSDKEQILFQNALRLFPRVWAFYSAGCGALADTASSL